jgi:hypothetical protein
MELRTKLAVERAILRRVCIGRGAGVVVAVALLLAQCGCGATQRAHAAHRPSGEPAARTPGRLHLTFGPAAARRVIARVGGRAITEGYLERWTPVSVILVSTYRRRASVPPGVVPDPPTYRRCALRMASLAEASGGSVADRYDSYRRTCEHEYEADLRTALSGLIYDTWIYEEAARLGVSISPRRLARESANRTARPGMLRELDVPASYQAFVVGAEVLRVAIHETLPAFRSLSHGVPDSLQTAHEIDLQDARFVRSMAARWRPRTHCDGEFLVLDCSGYKTGATAP